MSWGVCAEKETEAMMEAIRGEGLPASAGWLLSSFVFCQRALLAPSRLAYRYPRCRLLGGREDFRAQGETQRSSGSCRADRQAMTPTSRYRYKICTSRFSSDLLARHISCCICIFQPRCLLKGIAMRLFFVAVRIRITMKAVPYVTGVMEVCNGMCGTHSHFISLASNMESLH